MHQTSRAGQTLTLTLTGSEVWVIGDAGPTGGAFSVYVDGVPYRNVTSHQSATAHRKLLFHATLQPWSISRAHTVRIITLGTPRHWVRIDAIAVRR